MRCFVNLPIGYILDTPEYLDFFRQHSLCPELGADARGMDAPAKQWHRDTAAALDSASMDRAMHLPFLDLHPGSADSLIRVASARRLQRAVKLAQIYKPAHLIGHARFEAELHAQDPGAWVSRSLKTWTSLAATAQEQDYTLPPLYLENTFETDPEPVRDLAAALARELDTPVGICFDPGHWHAFACGVEKNDLEHWVDTFAPLLCHLHLHDNTGAGDEHLGMGQGAIDWHKLDALLQELSLTPTATLEPHTEQDFLASSAYLAAHPELFAWLR